MIIQTKPASVQIYRSGADVVRTGTAELAQGTNELEIRGLSYNTVIDTVKLFFPAGIGLADIHFRHGAEEDEERESVKIREEIETLKKKAEILELQASLWKENGTFSGQNAPDLKEVENYIEKLPERLSALNETLAGIAKERKALEKKLKDADRAENLPRIMVVLEVPEGGTYPFEVRYHEQSANWAPVYEVHTDAEGPLQLKVRARIYQYTEEEWKDVQTTLLTSVPTGGSLPVLDPLYLNFRTAPVMKARAAGAPRMMGAMKMSMMMDEAMEEDGAAMERTGATAALQRIETNAAEAESSDTVTEYALPGKKTIPSGTKGTVADLLEYTLPVDYEIVAVPKQDVRAYLAAKVKTEDLPEDIRGTAGIYLNGVYAGETDITADLTKETLDIPLGKEEGIQVSRTEKKRKTSEALIKNQRTTEYEYELKITNGKNKETEITVKDQIPVSREKTIIVETQKTDGAEKDDKGILTWKLKLAPKETKVLNLAYTVSWPKDKQLSETTVPENRFCPTCGARVEGNLRFCPECGSPLE